MVHYSHILIASFNYSKLSPTMLRSSAYPNRSTPISSNFSKISSNATKNNNGDIIPPCIRPHSIGQALFPTYISV